MLDPRIKLLGGLDVATARGLEIGALHNPRFTKADGDVRYLDHASADDLRAKYAADADLAPNVHRIVEVDYVWQPGQRVKDAVKGDTFDYVVASHVIEHVPNPIGWLEQLREILVPQGLLALVIPDKRYCFDVNRGLTTAADLVDADLRKLEVPSFRNIYDHEANYVPVDAADLWAGVGPRPARRTDVENPDRFALQCCLDQQASPMDYRDVHCHTFTPASFLALLETLMTLGLVNYRVRSFHDTEVGHIEFFVTLERVEPGTSTDEQVASVEPLRRLLEASPREPAALPAAVADLPAMELSGLEKRLIMRKRAAMARFRASQQRLKALAGRRR